MLGFRLGSLPVLHSHPRALPGGRIEVNHVCTAGRWDLARQGYVYDIAVGPYDVLFALCWDRDAPGSPTRLVQLVPEFGAPPCCHPADGVTACPCPCTCLLAPVHGPWL